MNKTFTHIIMTPFTGLGLSNGFRGNQWFIDRISIFKDYTLRSLQRQTNKNFIHWLSFREEEQESGLTKMLFEYLNTVGYPAIFTFGGIPIWDDKYPEDVAEKRLMDSLSISLPELKDVVNGKEYVLETILASDDMLADTAIEKIQEQQLNFMENTALVHRKGMIYDTAKDRLGVWNPVKGHLPPFYTVVYRAETFIDPKKHFNFMKEYRSHEDVDKMFRTVDLPDYQYCVTTHNRNISTGWQWRRGLFGRKLIRHPFIVNEIKGEAKNIIMQKFI